ncbi:response regulator [Rhodoferax sp. PAMC 29310]|uniref:response regulator n=1 Tax=Rhodoferax sp. PAMC 29310 TaxID=2822760 RepID=UPI001B32DD8D|nr:response regulator [Rhodoferax sp. PAMC 29310]
MNVLVIDDNEQNRYLLRFLLEARGHRVSEAHDGPQGIASVQTEMPDMVLLDIQLPGMDGYAVARALRTVPQFDAMPIIAVTSFALNGDRGRVLAAGCDDYIEKPIDPDSFCIQVEAAHEMGSTRKNTAA